MTLHDAPIGAYLCITALNATPDMRRRFLDMGFTVGSTVLCIGKSPAGDPRAYLVRGAVIAVRACDAKQISVAPALQKRKE